MKEKITDPVLAAKQPTVILLPLAMVWITVLVSIMYLQTKPLTILGLTFLPAIAFYPITYIFSDIFTEVYGYRISRKIVWVGMCCIALSAIITSIVTAFPYDPDFALQTAFESIFSIGPINAFAMIAGFFIGGIVNDYVVAKLKVVHAGKKQETRFILSTFLGQSADNVTAFSVFLILTSSFTGMSVFSMIAVAIIFCTVWEIIAIPITKIIVRKVKEVEGLDTYDYETNFNPFTVKTN